MEKFKLSIEGNVANWRYNNICIIGAFGIVEKELSELDLKVLEGVEVAPVVRFENSEFLAAFRHNPVVDVTLSRGCIGDTSIVLYNLYSENSKKTLIDIVRISDFKFLSLPKDFLDSIQESSDLFETRCYEMCKKIARARNYDFNDVFNATRYASFLREYFKLSSQESQKKIKDRFGVLFPV